MCLGSLSVVSLRGHFTKGCKRMATYGLIIPYEWIESFERLSSKECGELIKDALRYQLQGAPFRNYRTAGAQIMAGRMKEAIDRRRNSEKGG